MGFLKIECIFEYQLIIKCFRSMKKNKKTIAPALDAAVKEVKKSTTTSKKSKTKEDAAANVTASKVTKNRETLYVYPSDVKTDAEKKKFRATIRRKRASYEKEVSKLIDSKLPEDLKLLEKKEAEYQKFASEVFTDYKAPTPEPKPAKTKKKKATSK